MNGQSSQVRSKQTSQDSNMVVAVIPARSGSKGIPLKNLREVGFKPLICHTIEAALEAETVDRVVVSTDSESIAKVAKASGAEIPFLRPKDLADDKTPLAAVMRHFLDWAADEAWDIEALVILEPTAPLRNASDIDEAVKIFREMKVDTVVAAELDNTLRWELDENDIPRPMQPKRLNRQFMKPQYRENGAIFVTRPRIVTKETAIGDLVALYEMPPERSIDINTYWDMRLANLLLRSVKILLHFKATAELGFGHFYRVLALANRMSNNEPVFLCSEYDASLEKRMSSVGFRYILSNDPISVMRAEKPSIVINDILDTSVEYMEMTQELVPLVVNFEDLGLGSHEADLLFNALYDDTSQNPSHYGGAPYAILREEFLFLPPYIVRENVKYVTVTFGGSDPNNITLHSMKTLPQDYPEVEFRFILGPGYTHDRETLQSLADSLKNADLMSSTVDMVTHLSESDIVITSGGRTVFETAACGCPCIVICQNQRELTHRHISTRDGVINLGLFSEDHSMPKLASAVKQLIANQSNRERMSEQSSSLVDGMGIFRIIGLIEKAARNMGIAKIL